MGTIGKEIELIEENNKLYAKSPDGCIELSSALVEIDKHKEYSITIFPREQAKPFEYRQRTNPLKNIKLVEAQLKNKSSKTLVNESGKDYFINFFIY